MTTRSLWNSKLGFILASAGSAVGLGAIWKFPYMAGTNGGSTFFIPYLFFTITIGLTLLIVEMALGRATRGGAGSAFKKWGGTKMAPFGLISVLTGYMVMAFYSVVGGWCVHYLIEALMGQGLTTDGAALNAAFGALISDGFSSISAHIIFLSATAVVVALGVEKGIERVSKFLMPLLFFLMLVLIVRGLTLPGAWAGIEYLFKPDWNALNGDAILNAMGFAFFSLSVGSGSMMNYGSYLPEKTNIVPSTTWIVFLAVASAVLAGFMVMPAVFAFGLNPAAGPGLSFMTMPAVFAQLPFGQLIAIVFFLCLFVAALTSAISIMEMSVQYLVDEWSLSRRVAVSLIYVSLGILGSLSALSFNSLSDITFFGKGFFDLFDYATSNIGMPIGVLGLAILGGWVAWPVIEKEITSTQALPNVFLTLFRFAIRYMAPAVILIVMAKGLGLF